MWKYFYDDLNISNNIDKAPFLAQEKINVHSKLRYSCSALNSDF